MRKFNKCKKALIIISSLIFLFSNIVSVNAEGVPTTSAVSTEYPVPVLTEGSYILIEASTGEVLCEQNSDAKMFPASTTKIMTGALSLELGQLDQVMTASQDAVNDIGKDGSNIGIMAGEQMEMQELLKALLVNSANETANILAENLCPTRQDFVDLMNKKAIELGAVSTHFVNPCGAHDANHYTTAADLAKIAQYAMSFDKFREIVKIKTYTPKATNKHSNYVNESSSPAEDATGDTAGDSEASSANGSAKSSEAETENTTGESSYKPSGSIWPPYLQTTNRLMQYDDGTSGFEIDGVKTGYTGPAGYCLVSSATSTSGSNIQLISVVMGLKEYGSKTLIKTFSKSLLDYGFKNFERVTLIDTNKVFRSVAVEDAKDNEPLHLVSDGQVTCILPVGYDMSNIQETPNIIDDISAPVNEGDIMGYVEYSRDGAILGKVNLLASRSVEMKTQAVIESRFKAFLKSTLFKRIILGVCIFIPAFILLRLTLGTISRRRIKSRKY
ncbi:MAG: D-alanyl-D-alanine carboxypeptidase [Clostridiales bacterium]|nr:D-alanyl-D-alanine carboxypeptidase [Clostridiales bacterium]